MKPESVTVLHLDGPTAQVEIRIKSRMSRSQRRAIGLSFLRQIKPWLRYFSRYSIHPLEDIRFNHAREESERMPAEEKLREFSSKKSRLGFEIRMKRLEAGLTQAALAAKVGITRPHLSEIERGRCRLRESTYRLLESALKPPT